jgi:serine/threonine protein kinase
MKAQEAKEEIANGRKLDLARIDPGQLSSVSTIHTCPLPAKYRALISKTCARGKTHPSPTVLTSMDGGQSFQSYIERTDNPSAILQPLLPIFELVAALNSNRKYHMDIKPDNIVIRDGRARLIDYGLAIDSHPGESIDVYTQPYAIWPPELKLLDRKSYLDQRDAGTYEYFRSTFLKYNIDISALFREIIRIRTSSAPLTADEILGGADTWGLGMTLIISAYQIFNIIPARARSALDTLIKAMFHPDIRKRPAAGELAIMYRALIARYFP